VPTCRMVLASPGFGWCRTALFRAANGSCLAWHCIEMIMDLRLGMGEANSLTHFSKDFGFLLL
jgi:hypothetical protein